MIAGKAFWPLLAVCFCVGIMQEFTTTSSLLKLLSSPTSAAAVAKNGTETSENASEAPFLRLVDFLGKTLVGTANSGDDTVNISSSGTPGPSPVLAELSAKNDGYTANNVASKQTVDGAAAVTNDKPIIEPVAWVKKDQRQQAACCPYAIDLYQHRYAKIENRCCTSSRSLQPFQAVGGLDYDEFFSRQKKNQQTTIMIQGDSLAEQHFLGLVCLAWSSQQQTIDWKVQMDRKSNRTYYGAGATHVAVIDKVLTIKFVRWDKPEIAPKNVTGVEPDVMIYGGWHHGGIKNLTFFLNQIKKDRPTNKMTLIVEALPNHFPGGSYSNENVYPAIPNEPNSTVCVQSNKRGDPNVNTLLQQSFIAESNSTGMSLLKVAHLFEHRGDAHIGLIPPRSVVGHQGRDCLHYCVGVLDAIARQTLAHIATMRLS